MPTNLPADISTATGNPGFIHKMPPQGSDRDAAIRDAESRLAVLEAFAAGVQAAAANSSTYAAFQTAVAALTP